MIYCIYFVSKRSNGFCIRLFWKIWFSKQRKPRYEHFIRKAFLLFQIYCHPKKTESRDNLCSKKMHFLKKLITNSSPTPYEPITATFTTTHQQTTVLIVPITMSTNHQIVIFILSTSFILIIKTFFFICFLQHFNS